MIAAAAAWPAAVLPAQDDSARPRHKISAAALHQALSARFPLRFGLTGILGIEVSAPRLHLLASRNLLGAGLVAQASGIQLQQPQKGEMDLVFALRYEAADRTLRAHRPEILDLRLPGMARESVQALQRLLPDLAREEIGEVILHKFTPSDLALADTMGFEPDKITVQDDGLVIFFGPKRKR